MTEGEIDKLPVTDFSKTETPRRQHGFVGEPAAIRRIHSEDKRDMRRIQKIQKTLPDNLTDIDATEAELIEEAFDNQPGKERKREALYTFAVSGSEKALKNEIGELQGWINVYKDEYVENLQEQGKLEPVSNRNMVLNVAFASLPGSQPGQMASGLRQVCVQLSQIDALRAQQIEVARNRQSRKVAPEYVVTSYASSSEEETALTEAGFVNNGPIALTYKETGEVFNYNLYVLNWQNLNTIMHENADTELLKARASR